ncbi:MAG: hypothetical protein ACE5JN_15975 [Candidatus Methylomirabilia bacterium]
MPFRYYDRLSRAQKAIYDQSDRITEVHLPGAELLRPLVPALSGALASEAREHVEIACQLLLERLTQALRVSPVRVAVLSARPHRHWGELHGLYTESRRTLPPKITLWMRTARQRRVVAFRTFLRTLLHELCHHLDYRLFRLKDSYHTEGFYKREASLFHQLVPPQEAVDGRPDLRDHEPRPEEKHVR